MCRDVAPYRDSRNLLAEQVLCKERHGEPCNPLLKGKESQLGAHSCQCACNLCLLVATCARRLEVVAALSAAQADPAGAAAALLGSSGGPDKPEL